MTSKSKVSTEEATAPVLQNSQTQNLYVKVLTFDGQGKTIGERIVDMYHYGTRNWLQNHLWWSTHNGHEVEISVANDEDVSAYVAQAAKDLAAKFAGEPEVAAA